MNGNSLTRHQKSGIKKTKNRIAQIESEFDEPLRDIVVVMRWQGCNWKTISAVLGVSNQTLVEWRKKFRFARIDRRIVVRECGEKASYRDVRAKRLGYRNFLDAYSDLRFSQRLLNRQIADLLQVHENTLHKWIPTGMKGLYIDTEARQQSRVKNLQLARAAKIRKHGTLWTGEL